MKEKENRKPEVRSAANGGVENQPVKAIFSGLGLDKPETLKALEEFLGSQPGQSSEQATSTAHLESSHETEPAHNPFYGQHLFTPGLLKALQDVGLPEPRQSGKPSANSQSSLQAPVSEISFSTIPTSEVVDSLLDLKRNKGLKPGSLKTYEKRLRQFQRQFPRLPAKSPPIIEYLSRFNGPTRRYRRNIQDLLGMLYDHAVKRFGLDCNPVRELERPLVSHKPIRTLSLDRARRLFQAAQTTQEKAVLELLEGHGWRQIEVRRITAGDVHAISDHLIEIHGKEREELGPLLRSTEKALHELARGLKPQDHIFTASRMRHGRREPLGEAGMRDLVKMLMDRAGIHGLAVHDLRRTFATLVRNSCGDEALTMRLLRDSIPGVGKLYIDFPLEQLVKELEKHSPLSQEKKLRKRKDRLI